MDKIYMKLRLLTNGELQIVGIGERFCWDSLRSG
jgi:hypothetical protein